MITLKADISRIQRTNLETCITVHMHQKESTEDLVRKKIKDPTDFEWLKQSRFYWRDDRDTVIISICDVDFEYSFEYLGVKERLVITPLTDICYVTLSQVKVSCICKVSLKGRSVDGWLCKPLFIMISMNRLEQKMSFRFNWLHLDKLKLCLGVQAVEQHRRCWRMQQSLKDPEDDHLDGFLPQPANAYSDKLMRVPDGACPTVHMLPRCCPF